MSFRVRDYRYMDTKRLQDYASAFGDGAIQEIREIWTEDSNVEGGAGVNIGGINLGGRGGKGRSTSQETTMRVNMQSLFGRVYSQLNAMDGALQCYDFDDEIDVKSLNKGDIVEISRYFELSPLNQMIQHVFNLYNTLEQMGLVKDSLDAQAQRAMSQMALIFRQGEESRELPLVSRTESSGASVIFVAKSNYLIVDEAELSGDLTVFGQVDRLIPTGVDVDLSDLIKTKLPSKHYNFREAFIKPFEQWPEALGGPLNRESLKVPGPVLLVAPVAVY